MVDTASVRSKIDGTSLVILLLYSLPTLTCVAKGYAVRAATMLYLGGTSYFESNQNYVLMHLWVHRNNASLA